MKIKNLIKKALAISMAGVMMSTGPVSVFADDISVGSSGGFGSDGAHYNYYIGFAQNENGLDYSNAITPNGWTRFYKSGFRIIYPGGINDTLYDTNVLNSSNDSQLDLMREAWNNGGCNGSKWAIFIKIKDSGGNMLTPGNTGNIWANRVSAANPMLPGTNIGVNEFLSSRSGGRYTASNLPFNAYDSAQLVVCANNVENTNDTPQPKIPERNKKDPPNVTTHDDYFYLSTIQEVLPVIPKGLAGGETNFVSKYRQLFEKQIDKPIRDGLNYTPYANGLISIDTNTRYVANGPSGMATIIKKAQDSNRLPSPNISISDKNQKGLSNGGILHVQQKATIGRIKWEEVSYCAYWDGEAMASNGKLGVCKRRDSYAKVKYVSKKPVTSTMPIIKSYQIISARCNADGLQQKQGATNSQWIENKLPIYGSLKSPLVSNTISAPDAARGWRVSKVSTAFNGTDVKFFTAKKCGFTCTSEKNGSPETKNNLRDTKLIDGKTTFGAQIALDDARPDDLYSSDEFSAFRDNLAKEVRNDVWHPKMKQGAGLKLKGLKKPAIETIVNLDTTGTPGGADSSYNVPDSFKLVTPNGQTIIDKSKPLNKQNANQRLSGEVNKFKFAGNWSSDISHPHRININYVYKLSLPITVPSVVDVNSNILNRNNLEAGVNPTCKVMFNTLEYPDEDNENVSFGDDKVELGKFNNKPNVFYKFKFVKSSEN